MKPDVVLDFQYPNPINFVWHALTDSQMLERWIWENDFRAQQGYSFQFHAKPNEHWDGIVKGEVLEVDEPNRLSYTWSSAGENTIVTWTLHSGPEGTKLHLEQSGFSEETKAYEGALQGAIDSWTAFAEKLREVLN